MPYQVAYAPNSRITSYLPVKPYRLQEQVQEKRRQERRRNRLGPSASAAPLCPSVSVACPATNATSSKVVHGRRALSGSWSQEAHLEQARPV